MSPDRLQELIDLAHSDRGNPVNEALIEALDAYIRAATELREIKTRAYNHTPLQGGQA
jgi:hypothetical protein